LAAIVLAFCLAPLAGCGTIGGYVDEMFDPQPETALDLYEDGLLAMEEENYYRAIRSFSDLRDRYPFSPYTVDAELMLADAYYKDGDYKRALEAYKEFESLHPGHPQIPYVLHQVGMANLESATTIDRPQTNIQEALEYFTRLSEVYPESEYGQQAAELIDDCRRLIAEHEVYVADFYWDSNEYGAAWRRYTYIANEFQDLPDVVAYAEKRAQVAYLEHQKNLSRERKRELHGSWKDYFDWL
jgi:outer membrane protein assembly factor BamD